MREQLPRDETINSSVNGVVLAVCCAAARPATRASDAEVGENETIAAEPS